MTVIIQPYATAEVLYTFKVNHNTIQWIEPTDVGTCRKDGRNVNKTKPNKINLHIF